MIFFIWCAGKSIKLMSDPWPVLHLWYSVVPVSDESMAIRIVATCFVILQSDLRQRERVETKNKDHE